MARLLLIRHALTAATGKSLSGRLPGYSLTEEGRLQATQVAERLAPVPLTALYSSPLERTTETAAAIAHQQRRRSARTVRPHPGLLEVDYGDWSGRTLRSLYKLQAWKGIIISPSRVRFPNGESLSGAQERAMQTCEEIARAHRGQQVGLVTHADIIKAAASHYLGQPLDLFNRLTIAPASVTVVDVPEIGPARLIALNSNGDPTTWQ